MTNDNTDTNTRRTILRSIGGVSISPVLLSRATAASDGASEVVHYSSVGIVYDVDKELAEKDPIVHSDVFSYPLIHDGRILTRTASEKMRRDLLNNDRVVHHEDTHPVPVDSLGGIESPIVPVDLTEDLRPTLGFWLNEAVQLPTIRVVKAGSATKIIVPSSGATKVPVGEEVEIELQSVTATPRTRDNARGDDVELRAKVAARNHGEMVVTE